VKGAVIMRGQDRYHIVYRRVNPSEKGPFYAYVHYCPPKDGGAFNMPPFCMLQHIVLADVSYHKMMCVLFVNKLNIHLADRYKPIAAGPIKCELEKIDKARKVYLESERKSRMYALIKTFNSLNGFSMVGYPVGMHYDNYYDTNREYIENKCLFAIKSIKGSIGRGGSITGNLYVFGILDW
jgi:hypothetical protein